ncbi:DUF397 domain-containing protein [Kitasatospora sp. NPDC057198]|uniref:DUF397 domain-containing protein n=1 Tax=Kitasatospora sp. NPDC057198 TaxID=3346046 RepID=UPI00363165F7
MAVPEISARGWYKSSYSAQANDCVETAQIVSGGVAVRDSKNPAGPALLFPTASWAAFVTAVQADELPTA